MEIRKNNHLPWEYYVCKFDNLIAKKKLYTPNHVGFLLTQYYTYLKFHVYDYTIERHPWQVSENHNPRVHPSHVRKNWVVRWVPDETQD